MAKETKTLALRLDLDLHAKLSIIAELAGLSITDVVRDAVTTHLVTLANDPQVIARADEAAQSIRDAARAREAALQDMFGTTEPSPAGSTGTADKATGKQQAARTTKTTT